MGRREIPQRRATEVYEYVRVVHDRIYGLHERVAWRAAELGITEMEVARRMGSPRCNLSVRLNSHKIHAWYLKRLIAALGWESIEELHKPLPVLETAAKQAAEKLFEGRK